MSCVIFICTSNKDRSVCLENYFREKYPRHQYRSAGINKYHTSRKGTHYLTQKDLDWSDLIVYAENVHWDVVKKNFIVPDKAFAVLNCGEYERGSVGTEYLSCAETKLKPMLELEHLR